MISMKHTPTKVPVKKTRHTLKIGGYGSLAQAEADVPDYLDPSVFYSRTAMFPRTLELGINAQTLKSEVYRVPYPEGFDDYGVQICVQIKGPSEEAINTWIKEAENRIDLRSPTIYKRYGAQRPEAKNED